MARKRSTQRGRILPKGDRLTLRYCVRDPEAQSGWRDCREVLPVGITLQEAEAIREKRMETINKLNNSLVTEPCMTLEAFSRTLWVEYQQQRETQPSAAYSYKSMLETLVLPSFGRLRMDRITPAHLTKLMKAAREKGYSEKYRLNLYSLLRVMFDVAVDYDLITTSPVRAKLHRPDYRRKEPRTFTTAQLRALTEHVPEEHKLLCFTLGVLGLRCSELLALQWGDIQDGVLSVRRKVWRGIVSERLKTRASRKRMPLGELAGLFEMARREAQFAQDGDFIFCRPNGKPLSSDFVRSRILRPAMKAAGIPIVKRESGLHIFRHSAGTILYEMTRDIELVKRFLRHSNINTTSNIYVHPSDLIAAEAVETMAKVYFEVEGVQ